MRRLSLIISFVFIVSFSTVSYAGFNLGMVDAVKKKVEKLDEKVKGEKGKQAEADVEKGKEALEEAMELLGEGDLNDEAAMQKAKEANGLFKEALKKDPDNPEANLGAAITEAMLIGEDEEVKKALEDWLGSDEEGPMMSSPLVPKSLKTSPKGILTGKAMSNFARAAVNDPPTVSELQKSIKDKVIPIVDYIIARFEVLENSSWVSTTFEFKDGGAVEKVEVDKTDVYAADATLQLLKSFLCNICAWDLDIVYEDFENGDSAEAAIRKIIEKQSPYDKFLTLKDTPMLNSSGNSLDAFAAKLLNAMNSLENESDDQEHDLIPQPDTFDESWEKTKDAIGQLRAALDGQETIDFSDYDPEATDVPGLTINLAAFFYTNPIQDLRDKFIPAGIWIWEPEVDFTEEDLDQDGETPDFNDPTFNGLLPGMTNKNLKKY